MQYPRPSLALQKIRNSHKQAAILADLPQKEVLQVMTKLPTLLEVSFPPKSLRWLRRRSPINSARYCQRRSSLRLYR